MKEPPPDLPRPLHLFEGFGVELEYMIVDKETFRVHSLADNVLAQAAGHSAREVECGPLAWSNELVMHVIELKTNGPAGRLEGLYSLFQQDVVRINEMLAPQGACLLPGAMHPFMDPDKEAVLWEHEDAAIYNALDRIFGCQGHGWKNLQSAHLNLPFYDNAEFIRLHAAIRLILPLIPAIAASSPFMDGRATDVLDNRLVVYQSHCHRFPQAIGPVIPEPVNSIDDYHHSILEPLYRALRPHDPEGILAYEWTNARGAIARFERNTIEIRLVDVQECPLADLAVTMAIAHTVRILTDKASYELHRMNAVSSEVLRGILQRTVRSAHKAFIDEEEYLHCLGLSRSVTAGEIWKSILETDSKWSGPERQALSVILNQGPLAWRMKSLTGPVMSENLKQLCSRLSRCLARGEMLIP